MIGCARALYTPVVVASSFSHSTKLGFTKPVWAGRFVGTANYSVTVIGVGEDQNEYVHRDLLGMHKKHVAYKEMHMRHFQQDKKFPTGRSCLSTVWQEANPPLREVKEN